MVLLTILDGYGLRDEVYGNAVKLAGTPVFNRLMKKYPHTKLEASGLSVGLPDGQMGNSEVGHTNIGAGRVVYQPLEMINQKIKDGSFFENQELLKVMRASRDNGSRLHLMGLVSDGGVHSDLNHLMALLDMCKRENVRDVYLHLFTDGRDVLPKSAQVYIREVEEKLKSLGFGHIASISGRYYAMDRDNNYDRLKLAYDVIVNGKKFQNVDIYEYIEESYNQGITDEFLSPVLFEQDGVIKDGDSLFVFNFRKDRLREMLTALTNPEFHDMEVKKFTSLNVVTMMPVVESVKCPYAFSDNVFKNTLGEYIESLGLTQLRIAETEKYAHVTFFFDGGREVEYLGEDKVLIASPKVATYDMKPEMSAYEITDRLLDIIENYDLIILNFANGDMVGHTGNLDAAVRAVEVVDECLGKIYDKVMDMNGIMVIVADHGNCEEMLDSAGNILTSHTTNLVPFIVTKEGLSLKNGGKLASIAPTVLELMDLDIPVEMTEDSLIKK